MLHNSFPSAVVVWLTIIFLVSAVIQLPGPAFVRRAYKRWEYPPKFYRVTGFVELLIALFLTLPQTRIWGVMLAVLVIFVAEITLLKNEQYMWSVLGFVLMLALVPAALAI
jgi:DoxX-like family